MKNFITVDGNNFKGMRVNVNTIVNYWPVADGSMTRLIYVNNGYYDVIHTVEEIDKKIEEAMN